MARKRARTVAEQELLHRAARMEDAFHAFRLRRGRRAGHLSTVIPYTGYGSTTWVRVLGRVVLAKEVRAGSRAERANERREESIRGWRSFTSVPVRDVSVTVRIDGSEHAVRPDRGGVIDEVLEVTLEPGWHTVQMSTSDTEAAVETRVFIVDPSATIGIVSDVDDTVMVTALPRPFLAAWNTFVLDEHARVPTPGMAVLLERLAAEHAGGPVIYLSTGAWNVAPTLRRFLHRNLYPPGALLLTDWGPTVDRWFRSGREHKRIELARLARDFPELRWVLLGDDGQHDEMLYGEFADQHPASVEAVCIRQLSASEAVLAGGRSRSTRGGEGGRIPWLYSPDGAGLRDELSALGVLDQATADRLSRD